MRATINRVDGHVVVDGTARDVDCSSLSPIISVIQWSDETAPPSGHIEFVQRLGEPHMLNIKIVDLHPYRSYFDAWVAAASTLAEEAGRRAEVALAKADVDEEAAKVESRPAQRAAVDAAALISRQEADAAAKAAETAAAELIDGYAKIAALFA
jgi:hypothetical protein